MAFSANVVWVGLMAVAFGWGCGEVGIDRWRSHLPGGRGGSGGKVGIEDFWHSWLCILEKGFSFSCIKLTVITCWTEEFVRMLLSLNV